MEAGLARRPGKFRSRQLRSAPRKLPSEPRVTAVRLCVSGCPADWQLLGGYVASARTSSPLSSAGGGEGGAEGGEMQPSPPGPGVGRCSSNDEREGAWTLAMEPPVISELRLNSN